VSSAASSAARTETRSEGWWPGALRGGHSHCQLMGTSTAGATALRSQAHEHLAPYAGSTRAAVRPMQSVRAEPALRRGVPATYASPSRPTWLQWRSRSVQRARHVARAHAPRAATGVCRRGAQPGAH